MSITRVRNYLCALYSLPMILVLGCSSKSLVQSPPYATYTLSVDTANPASGVPISLSYADLSGATGGTASFSRTYNAGTSVILTAPSTAGSNLFTSWSGCTSANTVNCSVTVTSNKTVTANYAPPPSYTLAVNSTNPASGAAITVLPADNSGGTNGTTGFSRSYLTGTAITLTAAPTAGGNNFNSWTGCTTVSGVTCNVSLTSNRTVTANYVTPTVVFGLTVNSTNPSTGVVVTSAPADSNGKSSVSSSNTLSYTAGTIVTLTASATSGGQIFQSWSGCTTRTTFTCTVNMNSAQTVSANYYATPVGKTYYVGPGGSDSNSGLSIDTPFLTLQKAANATAAGDVVYVLTGTYTGVTPTSTVLSITTPGTDAAPIAYRAFPGNTPTISFSSFTGIGFGLAAAYIEVNGFTVNGNNQNVTYAQASTSDAIANPANYPQFNGNCIFADGRTSTTTRPNHISVLNNIVSNCGAGIGFNGTDYITISGNVIFNCAWYDAYGTSAVSLLASYNSDNYTGYKNYIVGNKIYNNYELIPYHVTNPLKISDGEGIIIDTNQNSAATSSITYAPYTGRTLIANNIIYSNGSSAVEIFNSSHVDIINNSSYGNVHTPASTTYATPTGRGELSLSGASDVNAYNNILYSFTGQNPVNQTTCSACNVDYNIYYNGQNLGSITNGPNDVYTDPIYANTAIQDLSKLDLSLTIGSSAIDTGTSTLAPSTDFNGAVRPQGKGYDRGAFER